MQILNLEIHTSSLEEIKDFYGLYMGFDILADETDSVSFKAGTSTLTFVRSSQNIHPYYHFAFAIPNNKYQEAKQWLKKCAELIEKNGTVEFRFGNGNAEALYFYDIAGNIVEFISHNALDNKSDKDFTAESVLSVCEAGFAVDSVPEARTKIENELGLKLFDKWNNNEQFAAMGDNEGLLVIVTKKRYWFPTIIQAASFPMKASIQTGSAGVFRTGQIEITSS